MRKLTIALALTFTACATQPVAPVARVETAPPPCRAADATINATLWMQTSAEYQAVTRSVYNAALRSLDEALADRTWTAATEQTAVDATAQPAIILDLDETVIDTSGHQAKMIRSNSGFVEAEWNDWSMHDASGLIEAARDFLLEAQRRGVAIFYVTNRLFAQEQPLRSTLKRHGIPLNDENVLTRGAREEWKSGDKSSRRAFVASRYRVIELIGDDLNDFAPAAGKTREERDAIVRAHAADWGRKWFAIPNPMYGSWERAATGDASGCAQLQKKIDTLRE